MSTSATTKISLVLQLNLVTVTYLLTVTTSQKPLPKKLYKIQEIYTYIENSTVENNSKTSLRDSNKCCVCNSQLDLLVRPFTVQDESAGEKKRRVKNLTLRPSLKPKRLAKKLRFGLGANCVGSVLQILSSSS